jgi:hypothetical protein
MKDFQSTHAFNLNGGWDLKRVEWRNCCLFDRALSKEMARSYRLFSFSHYNLPRINSGWPSFSKDMKQMQLGVLARHFLSLVEPIK